MYIDITLHVHIRLVKAFFLIFKRAVQAGETILITHNGIPLAELRPVAPRTFVPRAVIANSLKRAPRIEAGRFRLTSMPS